MSDLNISVGDFAVIRRSYHWAVAKVTKVTERQFKAVGEWGSFTRDTTYQKPACVFAGDEAAARALADRLTSSEARYRDEQRTSGERKKERDDKLIAEALSALPSRRQEGV